jgi:hypothetical protein
MHIRNIKGKERISQARKEKERLSTNEESKHGNSDGNILQVVKSGIIDAQKTKT